MIPHILHQIWLGSPPPTRVQRWMDSWRVLHPQWEYHLWTDNNRPPVPSESAFERAPSYAMKADLLRYELLCKFGGLYIDADFACHRPVTELLVGRDLMLVSQFGVVCNGVMAATPRHEFIGNVSQAAFEAVLATSDRKLEQEPQIITGPYLVDRLFVQSRRAFNEPGCLLPGDYFFEPMTRVPLALQLAAEKRYATHVALASWRKSTGPMARLRRLRPRTRVRRFLDLTAP